MATNFIDADIICPYYKKIDHHMIRCEGAFGCSSLEKHFDSNDQRDDCIERYCKTFEYGKCPIAQIQEKQYG